MYALIPAITLIIILVGKIIRLRRKVSAQRKEIMALKNTVEALNETTYKMATGAIESWVEGEKVLGRIVKGRHPTIH